MTLHAHGDRSLQADPPELASHVSYRVDPTVGLDLLPWDPQAPVVPMPFDRSADENRSLCFDGDPLKEALDIIGQPVATIDLASTEAGFPLHVALCDVRPDGHSTLICQNWIDTANGISPSLAANQPRNISVALYSTYYRIEAGHRLRLVIAGSDFPLLWPVQRNPLLTCFCGAAGGTKIEIPATSLDDDHIGGFFPPQTKSKEPMTSADRWRNRVTRDLDGQLASFEQSHRAANLLEDGSVLTIQQLNRSTVTRENPEDMTVTAKMEATLERGDTVLTAVVESIQTLNTFRFDARIDLDGRPYYRRSWTHDVGMDRANKTQ